MSGLLAGVRSIAAELPVRKIESRSAAIRNLQHEFVRFGACGNCRPGVVDLMPHARSFLDLVERWIDSTHPILKR